LDEVQQNSKLEKSLKKISNSFDVNKPKTKNKASNSTLDTNSRIDSNDGSFSILTDEILHVTSNGGEAWSFKIETPLLEEATFENFVITDNGEEIKFFIDSYITFEYNGETRHFLISILSIEDDLVDVVDFQNLINAKMHLIDGCLYNIPDVGSPEVIWCFGGGGENPISITTGGGETGTVYFSNDCNGTCSEWIIIRFDGYTYRDGVTYPCEPTANCNNNGENNEENNGESGENNEQGSGQFPENGNLNGIGTGGTGTPTTGEPTVGALPIDEVQETPKEKVLKCLDENNITLTQEQQDWLNDTGHTIKIKGMSTMIGNVGCETMINIILDYINASPPITEDFRDYTEEKLNCIELQNLLDNQNFRNAISALTSDVDDDDQENEKGFDMYNNNGSVSITPVPFEKTGPTYTGYTLNSNSFGGIHMHQKKGLFPMFSPEDIVNLYKFYQIYNRYNYHQHQVVHVLVTPQGVYALKIKNVGELAGFVSQLDNKIVNAEIALKIDDYMFNGYNQITGEIQNATIHQKKFLQFSTQDYPSGVSLYQLNFDNGWSWTKKAYNGTNNPPLENNCN